MGKKRYYGKIRLQKILLKLSFFVSLKFFFIQNNIFFFHKTTDIISTLKIIEKLIFRKTCFFAQLPQGCHFKNAKVKRYSCEIRKMNKNIRIKTN